jgi:hypothetical protein
MAGVVMHAACAHEAEHLHRHIWIEDADPGEGITALAGQCCCHEAKVTTVDADRALAEIEV